MSGSEEFPNKSCAQIQEQYFLKDLIQREGCSYYYRKSGLVSENNALLLFQINNEIIASARLNEIVVFDELLLGQYKGALKLYPDSIQVFKPFNYDDLKTVCPDVVPFTQTKQKLSADNIVRLLGLIEKHSQGYGLTDQAQLVTLETAEKEAKQLGVAELLKRIKNNKTPKSKKISETTVYYRDPYIKELVKRLAEGKCQLCSKMAPFVDKDGKPYLEEHHVVRLADGGQDAIGNVVALCPNCHRKTHILKDETDLIILEGIAVSNKEKAKDLVS
ncbi:MAG: HNH endonuclease [Desulfosporosinus sp.]|nr:HNH endonuclease [Desulfosporosinus sp.]